MAEAVTGYLLLIVVPVWVFVGGLVAWRLIDGPEHEAEPADAGFLMMLTVLMPVGVLLLCAHRFIEAVNKKRRQR